MPQKNNKKDRLSLDLVAKELAALAYDLVNGKLRIGSSLVSIGDPLFLKSKQKIKDGKAYFTLSFQSPLQGDHQDHSSGTASGPEPHKAPGQKVAKPHRDDIKASGAPEGKKLKKEMGRLWKSVTKQIEQDKPPDQKEAAKLIKSCENYTVFTDAAWQAEWLSCCEDVKRCLAAASQGDFATARVLLENVDLATHVCHKKYK